jgi:hypothetical protein
MLLSNQSDQFNKVLDHVLSPGAIESAVAEARGEGNAVSLPDEESAPAETDVNEVSKLLRAEAERAISDDRTRRSVERRHGRSPDKGELKVFPTEEEGREVAERYARLSEDAKKYLIATAERANKNPDVPFRSAQLMPQAIADIPPHFRELEQAGFLILEPYRIEGKSRTGRRITSDGFIAVRFFTAHGVVPTYLRAIVGDGETNGR